MPRDEEHELATRIPGSVMEEAEREAGSPTHLGDRVGMTGGDDPLDGGTSSQDGYDAYNEHLNNRTLLKLDVILLPFLSLLFLLNSLDKSNIGNAETAGFTHDAGLSEKDLNISLAFFFAFFVALQPLGAALGRRYGMARWVPACMSLWGLSTILHIWVRRRWQLILLRVIIATLEAGFYPYVNKRLEIFNPWLSADTQLLFRTTVSYLSLFYTRFEFAQRLGFFYGQTAVAGALGGVLSWAVFSHFPNRPGAPELPPGDAFATVTQGRWKSWEVLFLIEGCMTIIVALLGFFWLPHSADTAWFFNARERAWAEQRIRVDRTPAAYASSNTLSRARSTSSTSDRSCPRASDVDDEERGEAHDHLLGAASSPIRRRRKMSTGSALSVTADSGLSRHDVLSAVFQRNIWHLLLCNVLSAIPATAFGVFLPLVMKQLSPALDFTPAESNLLAAPPFAFGAIVLVIFTRWSDRSHLRLIPILWGLGILLLGLTLTVMIPMDRYILRYISLCILLSGSFIASPLTVAWLTNNTPEPGKRAILLGINGWGNLAGVFSALLFTPDDEKTGYLKPFIITLICVLAAFVGFAAFRTMLRWENSYRDAVCASWNEGEIEKEELEGDAAVELQATPRIMHLMGIQGLLSRLGLEDARRGDDKLTFRYGL